MQADFDYGIFDTKAEELTFLRERVAGRVLRPYAWIRPWP